MIKLQLLLRQPGAQPELDPALRARLQEHGLRVTGEGRASLSTEISEDDFRRYFGPPRPLTTGFAGGPYESPELKIPPGLLDAISAITVAPPNATIVHPNGGKNAPI